MSTSYKDHFIAFGEWSPDSLELDPDYMQVVFNVLPVYSGYRPVPQRALLSKSDDNYVGGQPVVKEVTGTSVHRTSESTSVETVQPDTTDSASDGIEVVPDTKEVHEVIKGLFPNDAEYADCSALGSDLVAHGDFSLPRKTWNAAGNIIVTVRYRINAGTGNYSIDTKNGYVDDLDVEQTVRDVTVDSGTIDADGDGLIKEFTDTFLRTLYPADADNRTLWWEFTVNADVQPTSERVTISDEETNGYYPVGGEATLFETLDKLVPPWTEDDTKYVQSPFLEGGEKQVFIVGLEDFSNIAKTDQTIHIRHRTPVQGMQIHVRLLEKLETGSFSEIQAWNTTPTASENPQNSLLTITDANLLNIIDPTELYLEIGFTGGVGSSTVDNKPTAITYEGNFTKFGAGTDPGVVGDDDDGTGWESDHDSPPISSKVLDSLIANFTSVPDPGGLTSGWKIRVRTKNDSAGGKFVYTLVNAEDNSQVFRSTELTSTASYAWYEHTLTTAEVQKIIDYNRLSVRYDRRTGSEGNNSSVAEFELVSPRGLTDGRVYSTYLDAPDDAKIEITHIRFEAPLSVSIVPGDLNKIYVGTKTNLFEMVAPSYDWDDVTRLSGDYTDDGSRSWDFASFGDKKLATNYADPVQVKNIGDTEFRALFGFDDAGVGIPSYVANGGEYPKARCMATISSFLCIGNIDSASVTGGRPYSFMNSRISDPKEIYLSDYEAQSAIHQIVSTMGEITAIIGGEYGIVMKEDSCYRAEYVRPPEIFDFPQISIFQGCPYPRSIVEVGADIYFWGVGGIFRITNGETLKEIGEGKISKFLFDTLFESLSFASDFSDDERENTARVKGAYDPYSGLVVWAYKTDFDSPYECGVYIVYNPQRDWFTCIPGPNLEEGGFKTEGVISVGNRLLQSDSTLRSVFFVDRISTGTDVVTLTQLASEVTYSTKFETNVISAALLPGVRPGESIEVHAIRPVYKTESGYLAPEGVSILSGGKNPDTKLFDNQGSVNLEEIDQREDGFLYFNTPVTGQFFVSTISFINVDLPATKEFLGVILRYQVTSSD
jgi:hypothetical protein